MRVIFTDHNQAGNKLVRLREIFNGDIGMVKIKSLNEREFLDPDQVADYKEKLRQLTDKSGLPAFMGELFLNEIKLSTNEANENLRERARLLGLI